MRSGRRSPRPPSPAQLATDPNVLGALLPNDVPKLGAHVADAMQNVLRLAVKSNHYNGTWSPGAHAGERARIPPEAGHRGLNRWSGGELPAPPTVETPPNEQGHESVCHSNPELDQVCKVFEICLHIHHVALGQVGV